MHIFYDLVAIFVFAAIAKIYVWCQMGYWCGLGCSKDWDADNKRRNNPSDFKEK